MVPGGLQDRQRDLKNNKNFHNFSQKGSALACPLPFDPKGGFPDPKWDPQNAPKSLKIRSENHCFFQRVLETYFFVIFDDFGRPEPFRIVLPCR